MSKAKGHVGFRYGNVAYTLIFEMEEIAAFEEETDLSIFDVVEQLAAFEGGGKRPKLSTLGSLLQAGLSRLHPDITRPQAMKMITDPDVMAAFGESISRGMPKGKADDEGDGGRQGKARPSKRGGAKKEGPGQNS